MTGQTPAWLIYVFGSKAAEVQLRQNAKLLEAIKKQPAKPKPQKQELK